MEMTNKTKDVTGLPVNIFFSALGEGIKHAPRIKFQRNKNEKINIDDMTPMMISWDPQIPPTALKKKENQNIPVSITGPVRRWILGNRTVLLLGWYSFLTEDEEGRCFRHMNEITDEVIEKENEFDIVKFKNLQKSKQEQFISYIKKQKHRAPIPKNLEELMDIAYDEIDDKGPNCSLNFIDTSNIKDMHGLFNGIKFAGDISEWDVSNVKDMSSMFYDSTFNGDISKWDVSNVTNTTCMFMNSKFNQDISNWNFKKLKSSYGMFENCPIKDKYKPKI